MIYYDAAMRVLYQREDPTFRFDPRTRPWYAIAKSDDVRGTEPYLFFATPRIGITFSLRGDANSVFGADVDLANASAQLVGLRPTPSSVIAIVGADGAVVAYSDLPAFARDTADFRNDRTPMVGDLHVPALSNAFAAIGSGDGLRRG